MSTAPTFHGRAKIAALTEERNRLRTECDAVKAFHERFETKVEARCTSLEAALTRLEERSAAAASREVRLREALMGVRVAGYECWCAASLGLRATHTDACRIAREALEPANQ